MNYIIVQAGGKGTRMEGLTKNKPKALVPVDNLPMIFHLFRKFPDKKFIIIGDYRYDVLEKYLHEFADVNYRMVCGTGHKGTCAGLNEAISHIPSNERFMLIWCDLILPEDYVIPESENNIIGISKDFPCRWKYENDKFSEERSTEFGVAGHFIFNDKSILSDVPKDGELVRWMRDKGLKFEVQPLYKTHEYGLFSEWDKLPKLRTRPFNSIRIEGDRLYKIPVDEQGRKLAVREKAWYKKLYGMHFDSIPKIYDFDPLCMEVISGKSIYEYSYISDDSKKKILSQIITCLRSVHALEFVEADRNSYYEAYIGKTFDRLEKVRKLVPFSDSRTVRVNGRVCRNIFYYREAVEKIVMQYFPAKFCLIHGDCTFSNSMLRGDEEPVLIDPRGYFGNTELYGDAAYDWVKLYYSLVSNYDQFNLKRFNLDISETEVKLEIASNNWESLEEEFFRLLNGEVTRRQMKILLAITWLSLTTYAWEDYDSICGAFYNGLWYLEDALEMESAYGYFERNEMIIQNALKSISMMQMEGLLGDCERTLKSGHKIIASGLGKNVSICEKFVGTMLSLGLDAGFLHTNSAVHGDMGMIHKGDLVIILTKSGATSESVYLVDLLKKREGVNLWLLSFKEHSELADAMEHKLIVSMEHEGDLWDIVPNNSTTINLIILQTVAIELSRRLGLDLVKDFKPNHPGGKIGVELAYGRK